MTRNLPLLFVALPFAAASSAPASQFYTVPSEFQGMISCEATTITFDDLPHGTQLFDQYVGVHFNGSGRIWDAAAFGGGGTYKSPPNVLFNYSPSSIDLQLDPPVDAFGWYNPSLFDAITVEFFGEGDVPLGSEVMPSFGEGVTFLGYVSDQPIHRVRATGVAGRSNLTIFLDSMTFGPLAGCSSDLDNSGDVGAADLAILLGAWGGGGPADLDCSGAVDAADLAVLLGAWGPCQG